MQSAIEAQKHREDLALNYSTLSIRLKILHFPCLNLVGLLGMLSIPVTGDLNALSRQEPIVARISPLLFHF